MMRRLRPLRLLLLAATLGSGCFGSKPTRFYMLSSTGDVAATADRSGASRVIAVGPIAIPDYVDRPQIVVRESANQVRLAGFDNWAGFTGFSPQDGAEKEAAGKTVGGFNPGDFKRELLNALDIFDNDRFVAWKPRVKLIDGDITRTVPSFLNDNPGVRFSLVHFDCDLYEPTHVALDAIWPKLARGGIVLFDEYGIHDWPGETAAVDQFLADKPGLRLHTFDWTNAPAAWLVKP